MKHAKASDALPRQVPASLGRAASPKGDAKIRSIYARRGPAIDPSAFVKMWIARTPIKTMAEHFGCYAGRISAFATKLRKAGVELPIREPWETAAPSINVVELNRIIQEHDQATATTTKGKAR